MAYGQLHTSTKYVTDGAGVQNFNALHSFLNYADVLDLQKLSKGLLLKRENEYYAEYGCNSYVAFRDTIRNLFKKAEQDRKAIQLFKKKSLDNIFGTGEKSNLTALENEQIEIHFNKIPVMSLQDMGFTFLDQKASITLGYNSQEIKTFLNNFNNLKGSKQLKPGTDDMKRARQIINTLLTSNVIDDIILLTPNNNGVSIKAGFLPQNKYDETSHTISQKNRKEYLAWKEEITNDIFNLLKQGGASEELQRAFYDVWSQKTNYEIDMSFFTQGLGKFKSNLQELMTAAIQNYIYIQLKGEMPEKSAKVIGDIVEGKREMPKTDVEMFRTFGIQVKAYQTSTEHGMEANIHPSEFDQGLKGIKFPQNLGDYIVQWYINASNIFDSYEFVDGIKQALAQVMSLQTTADLEDTVSFYFVDLQYLVPGSKIIECFDIQQPKNEIDIQLKYPVAGIGKEAEFIAGDDSFFASYNPGFKRQHQKGVAPNFIYYYQGRPDSLHPTEENYKDYDELYTHRISLYVNFDFNFMFNSYYSIY